MNHSIEYGPADKKRKVLGEIQNVDRSTPGMKSGAGRRKSLGFDSVRIQMKSPESRKMSNDTRMKPPSSLLVSNNMRLKLANSVNSHDVHFRQSNERSSQIPQPTGSHITTRLQNRFADVKNRLEKKAKINYDDDVTFDEDISFQKNNIIEQTSRNRELDVEINRLQSSLYDLELDNDELRRLHKKLKHRIVEMTSEIDKSHRKFEYRGEIIMKNVANRERLIDMNLKELSNKYKDEFNEAKFQLDIELKNAENYKDEHLQKEITDLEHRILDATDQLEAAKNHKYEAIKTESNSLQREVTEYLDLKTTEVNELTTSYETKDSELQQIDNKILEIENKIRSKQEQNEALKNSIESLRVQMGQFQDEKSDLESELHLIQSDIEAIQQTEVEWNNKLDHIQLNYGDSIEKLVQHNQQKRILENSIMDYEGKLRVYVKLPAKVKIDNNNSFVANNQIYQFNKVLDSRCSNHDVIEEFMCLSKSVVSGNNVSVIFLGSPQGTRQLIMDTLKTSYDTFSAKMISLSKNGWEYEFSLRVFAVTTDDKLVDYLNSCEIMPLSTLHDNLCQLPSQKMILEKGESIAQLSQFHPGRKFKTVAYIIEVIAKNQTSMKQFDSNLMLLDITNNTVDEQRHILSVDSECDPVESDIINYANCFSKCLNICMLDRIDSDTINILNALEVINNTDSPYKRRS